MYEKIANSTVRITCGTSSGSGFIYRNKLVVLTNFHVIKDYQSAGNQIIATSEEGESIIGSVVGSSPTASDDFAVLKLQNAFSKDPEPLQPLTGTETKRGTQVIFAGFPHGIPDLLVHQAIISGPAHPKGFYIDGSVNGGNSGGPVVDLVSGKVLGLITQRRFLGINELEQVRQELAPIAAQCQGIANRGTVQVMGLNLGEFAGAVGKSLLVMDKLLVANANSGIGIAFDIARPDAECDRLQLS